MLVWALLQLLPASRFLWRRMSWARIWAIAIWLYGQARGRLEKNLTEHERRDLFALMRKSKGRPGNLTKKERERFRSLVRKAAVGDRK
jgi:hypothetical protein